MYNEMKSIEIIEGCDQNNIPFEALSSKKPLVLKGLVKEWPVVQAAKRSPQEFANYLISFYRGAVVNSAVGKQPNSSRVFYNDNMSGFTYHREQGYLDKILATILTQEKDSAHSLLYMDSAPVDYCIPGFREKNDLPLRDYNPRVSLWLGNHTVVSAHYDIPDNIACVVAGKRQFVLFPPDQLANLYIGPLDFNPAGQAISMVDIKNPDYQKYPKFRDAMQVAQTAELHEGDAIFIPGMWWHHVEGLEPLNALINYWWTSIPAYLGSPIDAFNHAFLSIKSLPKEQRDSWKNLFDYYIFNYESANFRHIPDEKLGLIGGVDEVMARRLRSLLLNRLNR